MPADNIKKASCAEPANWKAADRGSHVRRLRSSGAAVLVNVATDNRNRTVADIRHVFSKNAATWPNRARCWMFERKSQIFLPGEESNEDQLMPSCSTPGPTICATTANSGSSVRSRSPLRRAQGPGRRRPASRRSEHRHGAKNIVKLVGKSASNMMRLSEALEEHDDVQNVYSNFEIDDEEFGALAQ